MLPEYATLRHSVLGMGIQLLLGLLRLLLLLCLHHNAFLWYPILDEPLCLRLPALPRAHSC